MAGTVRDTGWGEEVFDATATCERGGVKIVVIGQADGRVETRDINHGTVEEDRIEFAPTEDAAPDLAQKLGSALQRWTGNRWAVILVNSGTAPTIIEARNAAQDALKAEATDHPLMQAVLAAFPKSKITAIRSAADIASHAEAEALPEVEDEWDPFEED